MKLISLILSVAMMLGAFIYSRTPLFGMRCELLTDVAYGESENEKMDVYIPKRAVKRGESGAIIFIHGGSWSGGDKSEGDAFCRAFASLGYVTATVNYTLYNGENDNTHTAEAMLDEIDAALVCLKELSAERGISITAAATAGYSAGAHLALLYAYSRADTATIPIGFTASMVGPADFSEKIWGDTGPSLASKLSGVEITDSDSRKLAISAASPVAYISERSVPTLLAYGGRDELVAAANGESVKNKLDVAGVRCDYILFPSSGHGLNRNPIKFAKYFGLLREYARAYLE